MGKRARALTFAAALVAALVAPAQQQASAVEFAVSGTVTVNGAPLEGVVVYAYEGGPEAICCVPVSGAVTAADGTYSISLEPGSYRVRFYPNAPGYVEEWYDGAPDFGSAQDVTVGGAAITGIDASLVVGSTISGIITDEDGDPLEGVGVHAMNGTRECCVWVTGTSTAANGAYSLTVPNGTYRLFVYSNGVELSEWFDDAQTFEEADDIVVSGADLTGRNAQLAVGQSITGTVTNQDGDPLSGVYVHAFAAGACCAWINGAQTDEHGEYAIPVADGQYVLMFWPVLSTEVAEWWDGATDFDSATVVTVAGASATGKDAQLAGGNRISGRVTGTGGAPLENVFVGAFDATQLCCTWVAGSATDAMGNYRLDVPDGVYRLVVYPWDGVHLEEWFSNAGSFEVAVDIEVEGNDLSGFDFALSAGTAISGTVTGGGGPLEFVYVGAYRAAGECCEWVGGAGTNATGAYRLTVPAGTYKLMFYPYDGVFAPQWWNNAADFDSATAVTVGANDVVLAAANLATGVAITGTVRGVLVGGGDAPLENVYVMAFQVNGLDLMWAGGASTGPDGTYSIVVGNGDYKIQFYGPDPYLPEWNDDATDEFSADIVPVSGSNVTVDATLGIGLTITGTATDANGQPVPGVTVLASSSCVGDFVNGAVTDGLGRYSMTLAAGNYRISFWADGYVTEWWNNAATCGAATAVAAGSTGVSPVLAAGTGMAIVGGVVVDATTGQGIQGIVVDLDAGTDHYGAVTAAGGSYQFGVPATVTQGQLTFTDPTGAHDQQQRDIQLSGNATENAALIWASVVGTVGDRDVCDEGGCPPPLQLVTVTAFARDDTTEADPLGQDITDANGAYSIPLPPGEYVLKFEATDYMTTYSGGSFTFAAAAAQDSGGVVTHPGFGSVDQGLSSDVLTGTTYDGDICDETGCPPPLGEVTVTAYAFDRNSDAQGTAVDSTTSDLTTGEYSFSLPAGNYILKFSKNGYADEYQGGDATWLDAWNNAVFAESYAQVPAQGNTFNANLGSDAISGTVFDYDGSSCGDPLAGVVVTVYRLNGTVIGQVTTLAGAYSISVAGQGGEYVVKFAANGQEFFSTSGWASLQEAIDNGSTVSVPGASGIDYCFGQTGAIL